MNKYPSVQRNYLQGIINSVKKQNSLATPKQFDILQRLKTGDFNCRQVLLLGFSWLFFLLVSELANFKFNNKFYYNHWNIYWGLIGFSIALFLMR
jgi:hypothetical protein